MFFPPVRCWTIPVSALAESMRDMRLDGIRGNEGVVLWLGTRIGGEASVEHLVFVRGPLVQKGPDRLVIDSDVMNDVTDICLDCGLSLVGQIHSHGPWAGTDLSKVDHRFGVKAPYFLSLVAPDYAMGVDVQITRCGVHIYEPNRGYRRLNDEEVRERIRIVDKEVTCTVVGDAEP